MATDWDKELAKIDKQLASIPDEELVRMNAPQQGKRALPPTAAAGTAPAMAPASRTVERPPTRGWAVYLRVLVTLALAVGILFWPKAIYPIRCGPNLFLYVGVTGLISLAGIWSAVWTWRHRAAAAHVVSLIVTLWGLLLAAQQILPRAGYARPDLGTPTTWLCG
ncbi:MAG TPA: hypothetical protein VFS05_01935 [Gemmatimonadaceae bacterium]|nr:hypothetical protein [Gemmatimonadaceae bacterium]